MKIADVHIQILLIHSSTFNKYGLKRVLDLVKSFVSPTDIGVSKVQRNIR
jgi:hypothetical protein